MHCAHTRLKLTVVENVPGAHRQRACTSVSGEDTLAVVVPAGHGEHCVQSLMDWLPATTSLLLSAHSIIFQKAEPPDAMGKNTGLREKPDGVDIPSCTQLHMFCPSSTANSLNAADCVCSDAMLTKQPTGAPSSTSKGLGLPWDALTLRILLQQQSCCWLANGTIKTRSGDTSEDPCISMYSV